MKLLKKTLNVVGIVIETLYYLMNMNIHVSHADTA